jgi:alpha-tubulin suppressor-like RCC1 family protein
MLPLVAGAVMSPLVACGLLTGDAFDVTLAPGNLDAQSPNDDGAASDGANVDANAPVVTRLVTAGPGHTCAVLGAKTACWGLDREGELGDNATMNRAAAAAVFGLGAGVSAISAGRQHTCAVEDGAVKCWGDNAKGQLGVSTPARSLVPLRVTFDSTATAVATANESTCALMTGGSVQCWGANESGQLGNDLPSTTPSAAPVQVSGLVAGATAIAAGESHVCAVVNGGVRCWGWNHFGQLGDDTITDRPAPIVVAGLSEVVAVATGAQYTCALTKSGRVMCWGKNDTGQLGDGTTTMSRTPVQVSGLASGVKAIAAGKEHTCALTADGVHCWGQNLSGQLGNNSFDQSHAPFAVPVGLIVSEVASLAAGGDHTCVMTIAGRVQCWGSNSYGELGNGATDPSNFPVSVIGF